MEYYGSLHRNQAIYLKDYILSQVKDNLIEENIINILSLGYGEGEFEKFLLEHLRKTFPTREFTYTGIELDDRLRNEVLCTNLNKHTLFNEVIPKIKKKKEILKKLKSKRIYHIYLLIAPSVDVFYPFKEKSINLDLIYQVKEKLEKERMKGIDMKLEFKMKGYDLQIENYDNYIIMIHCLIASTIFNKTTLFYEVNHTGSGVFKENFVPFLTVKNYQSISKIYTREHALYNYILPISFSVIKSPFDW